MDTRTAEIIICLKGNHSLDEKYASPKLGRYYDTVAMYMADRCASDVISYTRSDVFRVIRAAVIDFIRGCDSPARFLDTYFGVAELDYTNELDECQRWCEALSCVRVRRGDDYINGFNEQLTEPIYPTY